MANRQIGNTALQRTDQISDALCGTLLRVFRNLQELSDGNPYNFRRLALHAGSLLFQCLAQFTRESNCYLFFHLLKTLHMHCNALQCKTIIFTTPKKREVSRWERGALLSGLANSLSIAIIAANYDVCDLALSILDELEAGRRRGGHELCFGLYVQRDLRLVQTLDKQ